MCYCKMFSFYGKYLPKDQHFAYGFTRMAENNQDIVVKAKNRVYRSCDSDKLVDNLFHLLISANSNCEVFNVGSSDAILIHDLAKKISKNIKLIFKKYEIDEKLPHDRYVPDTTKLNKLTKLFSNYNMNKKKIALITGVTGQDGAYLAKFLLQKIMKFMELTEEHQHLIHPE